MFNCFPTYVHAPQFESNYGNQYEVDFVTEISNTLVDFAAKLKKRQHERAQRAAAKAAPSFEQARLMAAANPQTDSGTLMLLARDADAAVRSEVIFNPATPVEVLYELASDNDRFVAGQARARLAQAA
jgi:hypothetical protein